jgi:hypothetical protein
VFPASSAVTAYVVGIGWILGVDWIPRISPFLLFLHTLLTPDVRKWGVIINILRIVSFHHGWALKGVWDHRWDVDPWGFSELTEKEVWVRLQVRPVDDVLASFATGIDVETAESLGEEINNRFPPLDAPGRMRGASPEKQALYGGSV